jgi:hypothetical protein
MAAKNSDSRENILHNGKTLLQVVSCISLHFCVFAANEERKLSFRTVGRSLV